MLDQLTEARDKAQNELAQAEIALMQSTAAAEVLREEVRRLSAAVAALSGEKAPADPSGRTDDDVIPEEAPQGDIHEMTPEEFDAERKRKQRQRQKELDAENLANNPYALVPCGGCGTKGSLRDSFITAPSGAQVRMLVCSKCNNQIMT